MTGNNARVRANSDGAGHAGGVQVTAGSVQVKDGALIPSRANSTGNGGYITVRARRLEVLNDGAVSVNAISSGNGGTIDVIADDVLLSVNTGGLFARQGSPSGTGHAGSVRVTAKSLQIVDGGRIGAGTDGPGRRGDHRGAGRARGHLMCE